MKAVKITTENEMLAILDSSMAVIVLSEDLAILQANSNCQQLFSCSRDLLIGQQISDIFRLHRANFPFTLTELAQGNEIHKKFTTSFKLHNHPEKKSIKYF